MNRQRSKKAIVFSTHRERTPIMLRAFSIRVFLFLFIIESYCHAQPTPPTPEIATIYIFDSKTLPDSAIKIANTISKPLEESFPIKLKAYLLPGNATTMDTSSCQKYAKPSVLDELQKCFAIECFNEFANTFKKAVELSGSSCSTLNSIPFWHIVIFKPSGNIVHSLCSYTNNGFSCSEPTPPYEGVSAFLKKIAESCKFSDLFNGQSPSISLLTNLTLSIQTMNGSPIFEIRKPAATCKSCPTKSQSCENLSLEVGSYELSAGWFNRIQQENVKGSDGSTLNISQKFNRISFTLPIGPANNSISISRITPHHRHRAGVGVLTSVLFFAALTGAGFLSTDIYNPCLSSPESLPTYRCIGTSGSQLTKQVMTGVGISGMLVGLSIGIPLVVVK